MLPTSWLSDLGQNVNLLPVWWLHNQQAVLPVVPEFTYARCGGLSMNRLHACRLPSLLRFIGTPAQAALLSLTQDLSKTLLAFCMTTSDLCGNSLESHSS